MSHPNALPSVLLGLRLSVFLVMLVWTIDKFVRPEHTAQVFQTFYFSPSFGPAVSYLIGAVQLVIVVGFLLGIGKTVTYGAVLLLHLISTLSTYKQYFAPYESVHILFFAAWPMLAACFALFVLREYDTRWTLGARSR